MLATDEAVTEGFRRRLESEMVKRGFNMKSLSLAAGLGETAVRDIIKRSMGPGPEKVVALARTLGVAAGWLLDGGEDVSATVAETDGGAESGPATTNRIAELRQRRGLTQTQLAEALGTGRSQVVKLERGERRLTVDWARRIATALGVEITDLIGQGSDLAAGDDAERRRQTLRDIIHVEAGGNLNAWAGAAGVSESTVRSFLDGTTSSMSDRTYAKLAARYGVSIAQLKGDAEMASAVPMPSSHAILIRRAAIQAAERIVAMAGPINAAPRDVVRQIVEDAFGFEMEGADEVR